MNHAIELYFDEKSTQEIEAIRNLFTLEGIPVDEGTSPHISLALYENADETALVEKVKAFSRRQVNLKITMGALGIFPTDESVLYLAPKVTPELLALHSDFLRFMNEQQPYLNPYYDVPLWTPHCTLGIRLSEEELSRAVVLLKKHNPLPITAFITQIGVLSYPPNKQVCSIPFAG